MSRPSPTLPLVAAALLQFFSTLAMGAESPSPADSGSRLFRNVESFWSQEIASLGGHYRAAGLELTNAPVHAACGTQATVSGPFYCTVNETVYLDLPFLKLLARGSKDPEATLGFVVAHEVGHHIQNIIGTTASMQQSRARSAPELAQRLFTTFELQADCYAGLWMHWAVAQGSQRSPADAAGLLQSIARTSQAAQSHLGPGQEILDPLGQGSPQQRLEWFHHGMDSGQFNDCDTFAAEAAGRL